MRKDFFRLWQKCSPTFHSIFLLSRASQKTRSSWSGSAKKPSLQFVELEFFHWARPIGIVISRTEPKTLLGVTNSLSNFLILPDLLIDDQFWSEGLITVCFFFSHFYSLFICHLSHKFQFHWVYQRSRRSLLICLRRALSDNFRSIFICLFLIISSDIL